ncbi:16S rRNA (cytidine(1402)-2'-O)-methyltransferase [Ovoidimarina sediminis]|uniref:16S rRNA (cytidine(1402)-2'-O)-methyltransferase n=1 Tax=Ovoidimarina sediminis TaxID=3079856 RepID=UPI002912DF87|nr:16S rRNA (cytidine(1402)-2'-O)-methyltransferase [Rhodophyticola sp. MJ-SS7]MDU8943705.1 16S rRNA (cytidine(1402)-2'-O)-methyltransferase [Rhodophyticola sp. MJ-SS7]
MSRDPADLAPGLYVVATPIGAARDITLRALDILRDADMLLAEDTRRARKLLEIHGIPLGGRPLLPYHDHNGAQQRPRILTALGEGKRVAQVSDAGTPLVADPGYALVRAAIDAGHPVYSAPGASAVLAALAVAGLPSDRFLFAGFLPPTDSARRKVLRELGEVPATLVFFETGRRLLPSLRCLVSELGGEREAAVCRELTKKFEETVRGTLDDLVEAFGEREARGEIVLLVDRRRGGPASEDVGEMLDEALKEMTVKDAARQVAEETGLPRRDVYQMALERKGKS